MGKGTNKREAQGMRLVPVLWYQMSVTNTSAARTFVAGTSTVMFHAVARTVVADSYNLARRLPAPCYPHSVNTFDVQIYQNYTALTGR